MISHDRPISLSAAQFLKSMPRAYGHAFSLADAEEHAGIVGRRGEHAAHAELWRSLPGGVVICVVADDQPGLLSVVTAALVAHGLDVISAQIYCRQRAHRRLEAVDFFWVRRSDSQGTAAPLQLAEVTAFARTLRELLGSQTDADSDPSERDTIPVPRPVPTRVYFEIDSLRRGEPTLIVETPDFPGLLFTIASALHSQGARIASSEVTTEGGLARDRFMLHSDGSGPFSAERLYDIQHAVHAAIRADTARSRLSSP